MKKTFIHPKLIVIKSTVRHQCVKYINLNHLYYYGYMVLLYDYTYVQKADHVKHYIFCIICVVLSDLFLCPSKKDCVFQLPRGANILNVALTRTSYKLTSTFHRRYPRPRFTTTVDRTSFKNVLTLITSRARAAVSFETE